MINRQSRKKEGKGRDLNSTRANETQGSKTELNRTRAYFQNKTGSKTGGKEPKKKIPETQRPNPKPHNPTLLIHTVLIPNESLHSSPSNNTPRVVLTSQQDIHEAKLNFFFLTSV